MSTINIDLVPESILTLTAGSAVDTPVVDLTLTGSEAGVQVGTLYRLSNVRGATRPSSDLTYAPIELRDGTEIKLGPYSEARRYELDVNSGFTVGRAYSDRRLNYNFNGTGIHSGGHVTINGSDITKIDIATGDGVILNNYTDPEIPDVSHISWPNLEGIVVDSLLTNFTSYIAIDRGGNIVQFADAITPENRRDYIVLCVVAHTNNLVVETIANFPPPAYDTPHIVVDLADSLGIVNRSGNQFTYNGTNLKVNKGAGESFRIGQNWNNSSKSPNITTDALLTAPTMFVSYRDGSGGWVPPPFESDVDPDYYDDGSGTLVAVPASDPFVVHRLFYEPIGGDIIIAYGQEVFKTMAGAEASLFGQEFIKNPVLNDTMFRCYLIVKRATTDLSITTTAKFISLDKFGSSPSVGSSTSTTDLQGSYDNSPLAEITTNSTNLALTVHEGTNDTTALIYCGTNYAGGEVYNVNGKGQINGAFASGVTGSRPSSPEVGRFYFDTTIGKPIWYEGADWVDATGSTV